MNKLIAFTAFFLASHSAFASCPDLSGTYKKTYSPADFRKEAIWTIKQNGCESYDNLWELTYKDGKESYKSALYIRTIDGSGLYWENGQLFDFQKDVNSEHCNTRGYLEQDVQQNLRYSWRFECPEPNGTGPWYTPETTNGWTGELYVKEAK